jgi:DNA-binding transcriptional LysR family regulator
VHWDDLKYLLAVAEAGALAPAAKVLRVDPSTVSRRIAALEKALGSELVARTPEGMSVTTTGERAVDAARRIEAELEALAREVAADAAPTGTVVISTTEAFAPFVIRVLATLHERCPGLRIEVVPSMHKADLRRREADLAVRMFREERDGLAQRKLGSLGWSLYATSKYLATVTHGRGLLDGHTVIGYTGAVSTTPGAIWLAAHASEGSIRMRCGTPSAAMAAALADTGVCVVPSFITWAHPDLVRLTDQVVAQSEIYAVFLPERRTEARLRVVIDALLAMFARDGVAFARGVPT